MGLMNSADTMAQLQRGLNGTDFFLHIGDLSYADDFYLRPNNTYEGSWDAWQDLMAPMTSAAPYMVTRTEQRSTLCHARSAAACSRSRRFSAGRSSLILPLAFVPLAAPFVSFTIRVCPATTR